MFNRIVFIGFLFLLTHSCAQKPELSNIVFIIADDISWNDFGCYGNPDVRTPNIDRMAAEGLKFNNVYLTASSCSPSRTSIISGRYPHNTAAAELHTAMPGHLPVFPEELKAAGYFTGASGKWHMGEAAKRGFDTLAIENVGPGGEDHWISLLRERPANKPFFFWFAALDAHRAWSADSCDNPHDPDQLSVPVGLANLPGTRQDLASYYNEVQRFDSYVGMVRSELERQGVLDNTLIIVMADNGRPFPRAKTLVFDSGMKTPFIAFWPKGIQLPGEQVNALVSVIDLAPTFTSLAGIESNKFYQGRSFTHLFASPDKAFREVVFAEHNWHDYEAYERMVRTQDDMYVYNGRPLFANQGPADAVTSPSMKDLLQLQEANTLTDAQSYVFQSPRRVEELYLMSDDHDQLNDLSADPAYESKLIELRSVLKEWQSQTADTEPAALTPDWYLRRSETYTNTEVHSIRGEMPGIALRADTVTSPGPF